MNEQPKSKKKNTALIIVAAVLGVLAVLICGQIIIVQILNNMLADKMLPSDEKQIYSCCVYYYQGIGSGSIYQGADGTDDITDPLPAKDAAEEERREAALNCTIGGALMYYGSYYALKDKLNTMGADKDGNIYRLDDPNHAEEIVHDDLTIDTTFGEIGFKYVPAAFS